MLDIFPKSRRGEGRVENRLAAGNAILPLCGGLIGIVWLTLQKDTVFKFIISNETNIDIDIGRTCRHGHLCRAMCGLYRDYVDKQGQLHHSGAYHRMGWE